MNKVLNLIQELKNKNTVIKEEEYNDDLKPGVPLREIKLKASDGTNLHETKFGGKPNWIQMMRLLNVQIVKQKCH
jgi:hypothetical protein